MPGYRDLIATIFKHMQCDSIGHGWLVRWSIHQKLLCVLYFFFRFLNILNIDWLLNDKIKKYQVSQKMFLCPKKKFHFTKKELNIWVQDKTNNFWELFGTIKHFLGHLIFTTLISRYCASANNVFSRFNILIGQELLFHFFYFI